MSSSKWGVSGWGAFRWGAGVATEQGAVANAKQDTRLLLNWGASPTADQSQRAENMTTGVFGVYQTSSASRAIDSPREVTVKCQIDNTNTGVLVTHGDHGNTLYAYRMRMTAGNLICEDSTNGSIFGTVAIPNIAATTRTYTFQWCTTHNRYLTTGASDAYRAELTIIDHNAGTGYQIQQATHAAHTSNTAHTLSVGMRWDGAAEQQVFDGTLDNVRIGVRFHSSTEAKEDWVAESAPAVAEGERRVQEVPLPARMGADAEFAGPQYLYSARAHNRNSLRLVSPLVNLGYQAPPTHQDLLKDTLPLSWQMNSPGSTTFEVATSYLRYVPVPPTVNRARVRVNVQLWDSTAGTPDNLKIRCYSRNIRPGAQEDWDLVEWYSEVTHSTDDGSGGPGSWSNFATDLPLARTPDNWTWLFLAFETNGGASSPNNRYKVWSWTVEPILVPPGADEDYGQIQLPP